MLEAGADEVYPSFRGAPRRAQPQRPGHDATTASADQGQRDDRPPVLAPCRSARTRPTAAPTRSAGCTARPTCGSTTRRCCPTAAGRQPAGHGDGHRRAQRPAVRRRAPEADSSADRGRLIAGAGEYRGHRRAPAGSAGALHASSARRRGPSDGRGAGPHQRRRLRPSSADVSRSSSATSPSPTRGPSAARRGRDVDVLHTAGIIHPTGRRRVRSRSTPTAPQRGRRRSPSPACGAWCTSRRTARSAPTRTPPTRSAPTSRTTRTTATAARRCTPSWRCRPPSSAGSTPSIVRPPWFYGPHQPPRQTTFFRLVRAGRFPVVGDGEQRRSMVYVDNLVDGVLAAELHPRRPGAAYWIADARPYTVNEIVATVGRALDRRGLRREGPGRRLPAIVGRSPSWPTVLLQRPVATSSSSTCSGR